MKTPNITTAQIVGAIFGAAYPVITLLGFNLDPAQVDALQQLNVVAVGLFGADAAIRIGRNYGAANGSLEPVSPELIHGGFEIAPGELTDEQAAEAERLESK